MDTFAQFDNGAAAEWKAHPKFAGVFLKDLVGAEQTGGALTCHLVRIEPGCAIGRHAHPDSLELHEVVDGDGYCWTPEGEKVYTPGTVAVLAADLPHEVHAGAAGLRLFAKFVSRPH